MSSDRMIPSGGVWVQSGPDSYATHKCWVENVYNMNYYGIYAQNNQQLQSGGSIPVMEDMRVSCMH
jgi:hypothetical protein